MGKLSNSLTMLKLLSTGKRYGVMELSELLEVTPRMIRVYKEDLEKAGIYIDTIRGPYGGYVLKQGVKIPERVFIDDDIVLLDKISHLISEEKLLDKFNIFYDKIKGFSLSNKDEKFGSIQGNEDTLKYNLLARAIKEKRKVKICYYSFNKGENERIIHPYDLFLYSSGWGVASFCESRGDLRHFELKRIIKCELLDDVYE